MVGGFDSYMNGKGHDACKQFDKDTGERNYSLYTANRLMRMYDDIDSDRVENKGDFYSEMAELYLSTAIALDRRGAPKLAESLLDGDLEFELVGTDGSMTMLAGIDESIEGSQSNGGDPDRLKDVEACLEDMNSYFDERFH